MTHDLVSEQKKTTDSNKQTNEADKTANKIDKFVQTIDFESLDGPSIETIYKFIQTEPRPSLSGPCLTEKSAQTDERLMMQWISSDQAQEEGQESEDGLSWSLGHKCREYPEVQNLLLKLQEKLDSIGISIADQEQAYISRVDMLQEENARLETQLLELSKQAENFLEQKQQEIAKSQGQLPRLNEQISIIESNKLDSETKVVEDKNGASEKESAIDFSLIIRKEDGIPVVESGSAPVCVNILETIIKCLQARIQYKDESIAHYQRIVEEMRSNYEQEIRHILATGANEAPSSSQIRQAINNEQLEAELVQRNEELQTLKLTQQKYIRELRTRLELQHCQLKKLKSENERLKSSKSLIQVTHLRTENEKLKESIEFQSSQIEQLRLNLKEERSIRLHKQR